MRQHKIELIFCVNHMLLILFYFTYSSMLLAPLWGLTYLVFFVFSVSILLNTVSMKRLDRRTIGKCFLHGALTLTILAIVMCAMAMPVTIPTRIALCTVTTLLSAAHAKTAASFIVADDKYIRTENRLKQADFEEFIQDIIWKRSMGHHEKRMEIATLNIITSLLSAFLLLLGTQFRIRSFFIATIFCVQFLFLYLSHKKYGIASMEKRQWIDMLLAGSAILLLILQRCISPYSVNFIILITSVLLMCPYWLTAHELLCRFQLGWEFVN